MTALEKAGATLIASWVLAFAAGIVLCMALSGCAVRTCNPGESASMWCHQSW